MISTDQIQPLIGHGTVVDGSGGKIGSIQQVFVDDVTGDPEWVTVKTGMFGSSETFVPLAEAGISGDAITVPYTKETVKDAPRIDTDGHLSPEEESTLYTFYGLQYDGSGQNTDTTTDVRTEVGTEVGTESRTQGAGHDTSGPNTDDAMTRSEERLHVGTERVQAGKAKLRKYVVTENVTKTVPVSHEELRIEREPITDANRGAAMSGGDITEEEHEVTLTEERAVVSKETVPVERVKLGTETVTEQKQVDEEVRKERIELDDSTLPENSTTQR